MPLVSRRALAGLALTPVVPGLRAAAKIDDVLRDGIVRWKIPAVAAAVASDGKTLYSGAFGKRDSASGAPVTADSIFAIASMTKAITTTAALQLVERGKLKLDEPVANHLPALANLQILHGVENGKAVLRPAQRAVTLRLLLTHTAGFGYETWDRKLLEFTRVAGPQSTVTPLTTEPGTRWEYGTNIDWAGRLVEAVSGETLEAYFQKHILQPLGMTDTSFILPAAKFDRKVAGYDRAPDGSLHEQPRVMPAPPKAFNGGGGLYSTTADYVRFMQMILRDGKGPGKERILDAGTVALMKSNQIGSLDAGRMTSFRPDRSADVDFHPGFSDRFTFGFLLNPRPYAGGRSAGSLAWAGLFNTFYWIDPSRKLCATIMMQFLPFCDPQAMGLLREFERAVYTV